MFWRMCSTASSQVTFGSGTSGEYRPLSVNPGEKPFVSMRFFSRFAITRSSHGAWKLAPSRDTVTRLDTCQTFSAGDQLPRARGEEPSPWTSLQMSSMEEKCSSRRPSTFRVSTLIRNPLRTPARPRTTSAHR
jgi:hypothetical protein